MNLTYRGVKYNQGKQERSTSVVAIKEPKIIYRGNSPKAITNPKFPWLKYIKQLFGMSESRLLDPIAFWYNHKREFIKDCWYLDEVEKLQLAWDLTLQIERAKTQKSKQKTKLKYRGVTYYR